MRIAQVIAAVMLLTQQVVSFLPVAQTASIAATNRIAVEVPNTVQVNFATATPVTAVIATADIEKQMLEPLRTSQAAQAAVAAEAKAKADADAAAVATAAEQARKQAQIALAAQHTVVIVSNVTGSLSAAAINYLGTCESGMTWNRNSGNGFYGAFQFTIGTWNNMNTGYARADLAPLDVQVQAVQNLLSRSSIYSQFPACARKMSADGLI